MPSPTTLPFTKMHGLGNDFIMIKGENLPSLDLQFLSKLAKTVCDRNFGIGGDGMIVNAPPPMPPSLTYNFYTSIAMGLKQKCVATVSGVLPCFC